VQEEGKYMGGTLSVLACQLVHRSRLQIPALQKAIVLAVGNNLLTGSIPSDMRSLKYLYAAENQLSGGIDVERTGMRSVR
jgi:hypothetical protein